VSLQVPPLQSSFKVHDYGSGNYSLASDSLELAYDSLELDSTLELDTTTSLELDTTTSLELATTSLDDETTLIIGISLGIEDMTGLEEAALKMTRRSVNIFLAFVKSRLEDTCAVVDRVT
jgi:hypothetical protein